MFFDLLGLMLHCNPKFYIKNFSGKNLIETKQLMTQTLMINGLGFYVN